MQTKNINIKKKKIKKVRKRKKQRFKPIYKKNRRIYYTSSRNLDNELFEP